MRRHLLVTLLCSSLVGLAIAAEQASVREFAALLERPDVLLVDVRTPEEIADGKIKGAIELDFNAPHFARELDQLPKDRTILVYCRSDNRSGRAAALLEQKGFGQVVDLKGGILAWKKENMPLVSDNDRTRERS